MVRHAYGAVQQSCSVSACYECCPAVDLQLREHIRAGYCLVYLDDILIMSKSAAQHAEHLDAVLQSLHSHQLYCQLPECEFALPELRYLRHLVNGTGVKPDPKKVASLESWQPPLTEVSALAAATTSTAHATVLRKHIAKQVRSFLGFMQYFSRFVPRFSDTAAVLYDVTKDSPAPWSDQCTAAWNALKACLLHAAMMHHPDFSKPFHVYFDASITGIGGLLAQDVDGNMCPAAFCARRMQPAEVNYTTTEQEFLAMVHCFRTWRCYLEGTEVFAHTDRSLLRG